VIAKKSLHCLNRIGDPRHHGIAALRVLDCKSKYLLYVHRAVVAKQRQPASERSGHASGK